jgi:(p)ppGpp synthase/HD superfamily hydrolase
VKTFDGWESWSEARGDLAICLPPATLAALDCAFTFASTCHGEQTRPNGEPYTHHLLEVVEILLKGAGITDEETLVAGVLHDIVEDTPCSLKGIRARFGSSVADLVGWLTMPTQSDGVSVGQAREEYFAHLQSAPLSAVAVKLADRLSNVQKLEAHPRPGKQKSYYRETVEKVIPLARRIPWFDVQFQTWRERFRYLAE